MSEVSWRMEEGESSGDESDWGLRRAAEGAGSRAPLDVPASLFQENNKLLEALSEEVKRLRTENKGLSMNVESLSAENVMLIEKMGSFSDRISTIQARLHEMAESNEILLEKRIDLKMQVDALVLKLAESELAVKIHRQHFEAADKRESAMRLQMERLGSENTALRKYSSRLEDEASKYSDVLAVIREEDSKRAASPDASLSSPLIHVLSQVIDELQGERIRALKVSKIRAM